MAKVLVIATIVIVNIFYCNSECSNGVYEYGVSDAEAEIIVNAHNNYRLQIARGEVPGQPRGIDLKRLKWDVQLAVAGQDIANTCVFEHVPVEDDRWWWVGQNLYKTGASNYQEGSDWNSAVTGWFDEYKNYNYPDGFSPATGHYTQVVWAETEYVGCGYTHYPEGGSFPYAKMYVCNYGVGGNVNNAPPYQTGDSGCENLC